MTIAEEILVQLGGRKFIACTGCSNFHSSGDQDFLVTHTGDAPISQGRDAVRGGPGRFGSGAVQRKDDVFLFPLTRVYPAGAI